ncbi:hypothetical protein P10159_3480 [Citrobacter portucalensis]|nr:hypothetical protein P10159_3480 [Citrobacter portucalensis]
MSLQNCSLTKNIIAQTAKDFAHFANFTAPLVGVKSSSNVFP